MYFAVSLARRLQDPLLEYIKVHPMHMGVGMYQHDIPERILHASLDSVMTECVSFVGVDINSASEFVLRSVLENIVLVVYPLIIDLISLLINDGLVDITSWLSGRAKTATSLSGQDMLYIS